MSISPVRTCVRCPDSPTTKTVGGHTFTGCYERQENIAGQHVPAGGTFHLLAEGHRPLGAYRWTMQTMSGNTAS